MHKSQHYPSYLDLVAHILPDIKGHFLSIDAEDYTTTVDSGLEESELRRLPSNLKSNLDRILDEFGSSGYQCTFFVLGRIAGRIPLQVKRMVQENHEVASHGMSHKRVLNLTPKQFRQELVDSRKLLEDLSGSAVTGFRAPMFSITLENLWALDELVDAGYRYDSSIAPVSNFAYGIRQAPRLPHKLKNGLIEIPMSVFDRLGYAFMTGGGFYLRAYPLWIHKLFLRLRKEAVTVFYLHPWELDRAEYNLWDQLPDKGKHWDNRPFLMKHIETWNRRKVLEKYMALLHYQCRKTPPTCLGRSVGAFRDKQDLQADPC